MNRYELMAIITPDIGSDGITKRTKSIHELITSNKGEIFLEDMWGMRGLSYPIKKQGQGFYAIFYFTIPGEALQEIDTTLRLENEVLRHLLVVLPNDYEPVTMKVREEQYVKEFAEQAINEAAKDKESAKQGMRKKKTEETEVVKKTESEKVKVEEEVPEPSPKPKKTSTSAGEVDKKLADVLDNPDLNL